MIGWKRLSQRLPWLMFPDRVCAHCQRRGQRSDEIWYATDGLDGCQRLYCSESCMNEGEAS